MIDRTGPGSRVVRQGVPLGHHPPVSVKQLFNHCAEENPERDYLIINDTKLSYRDELAARKSSPTACAILVSRATGLPSWRPRS